jgi:ATP-binding protein involved in chromosome partitioning
LTAEASVREAGEGVREKGIVEDFNDIDHVIAVMSCKGGVGKSLVSGLLAVALRREGYQVGILDADIAGPSIPKMFFSDGAGLSITMMGPLPPKTETGIRVMSMNLLPEQEYAATAWRGPLISGAIRQFWGDILWGELDYLIVDLPPGTSDAALTVMQSLPISGIVLVTSPQVLASMVVCKAAHMAQQMEIPILGLVENMSYYECPHTGEHHEIFGPSYAEETAEWIGVSLLGRLPVDPQLAMFCDNGCLEYYDAEDFVDVVRELVARTPEAQWRSPEPLQPEGEARQEPAAPEKIDHTLAKQY